jgi:hypothetical protein
MLQMGHRSFVPEGQRQILQFSALRAAQNALAAPTREQALLMIQQPMHVPSQLQESAAAQSAPHAMPWDSVSVIPPPMEIHAGEDRAMPALEVPANLIHLLQPEGRALTSLARCAAATRAKPQAMAAMLLLQELRTAMTRIFQ